MSLWESTFTFKKMYDSDIIEIVSPDCPTFRCRKSVTDFNLQEFFDFFHTYQKGYNDALKMKLEDQDARY